MITFDKIDKSVQNSLLLLIFILAGLTVMVIPWIGIHTNNFNIDNMPISLKCTCSIVGIFIIILGMLSFKTAFKDTAESSNKRHSPTCINDKKRNHIIREIRPDLYLPLEENFLNLANNPACDINVFPYTIPYINKYGEVVEKPEFVPKFGYRFNGKNMISVQMKQHFPYGQQARTFVFAVNKTEKREDNPMFFFSYGQRYKHDRNDKDVNNHDKSFGLFDGEPKPYDHIPEKYIGKGVRIFFYCEHYREDRTSEYCDTERICDVELNEWAIFAVTYNGQNLKFFKNGTILFDQNIELKTSKAIIINIGGFVHHNEQGAIIARDLDYSMNGFIREFIMTRRSLNIHEIEYLTSEIKKLLL